MQSLQDSPAGHEGRPDVLLLVPKEAPDEGRGRLVDETAKGMKLNMNRLSKATTATLANHTTKRPTFYK